MQPATRRHEELPKAQTSKGFSGNKLALARPLCPKKLYEQGVSQDTHRKIDIGKDPSSPMTIKHLKIDQSQKPGTSDTNAFSKGPTRIGGKFFNRRKSSNMSTSFGNYTVITSKRNYEVLNPDLFSPSNAMHKKNLAQMLKQKYPPPVTMMLQPPPADPTAELRRGYHARKDSQLIEEALSEDSAKASPGAGKPRMLSSEMLPEPGFDDPQATQRLKIVPGKHDWAQLGRETLPIRNETLNSPGAGRFEKREEEINLETSQDLEEREQLSLSQSDRRQPDGPGNQVSMNDIPERGALGSEQEVEQSTKAPNSPPNRANHLELRVEPDQSDTERDRVDQGVTYPT